MLDRLQLWELGQDHDVSSALGRCLNSGLFELVEPDYLIHSTNLPNDPSFTDRSLWHLDNSGQTGGLRNADINALEGWDIRHDAESIIVGIIDTGARTTHEDLRANLWRNPKEIPGNQIDDDNNGYVDDIHGINAILDSGDPADDAGHGTHVTGLVGAVGNNQLGVTGVAWKVQLMPLRFLNRFGEGATSDAIQCINYAVANGAKVINTSWGSNAFSGSLNGAISLALQADVIIVAAAGNERRNNDVVPLYPANYAQNNILSVAATTNRDTLAGYSNYGATTVDLAAPGNAILSTWGNSDQAYQTTSGTSMSSPIVAGAAALMRAHFPNASATEIAARILATTDPLPALRGRCVSGGRLNLALSLGPDLIAGFTMSPSGGAPPLQVRFEDRSLGDVTNWFWDFGDGQSLQGLANPSHTFNRAGNFPVTLRIESSDGFSVSRTQSIPILANYRVEFDFFNWITLDNPTTLRLGDNDVSAPIPLPFLFPFYARAQDEIMIGSNGILGFDEEDLDIALNQSIPDAATPNALICPYWDDLDPSRGGRILYGTTGEAPNRKFVVTWDRVPHAASGGGSPLTFQAALEEGTQRIIFQYQEIQPGSAQGGGASATIGVENHGGFLAAKHSVNGSRNLRNEQTYVFTPLSSNGMIVGPERDLLAVRELSGNTAQSHPDFELLNTGSAPITWQANADQEWVLLSKTQGVLGAGQAAAVGIRISPTASTLSPGSHFSSIQFRNLTTGTGSVDRRLQLVINGEDAHWNIAPSTPLAASGSQGGPFNPLSRIYTLNNDGDRIIDWTIESDTSWIDVDPMEATLAAGVSETLSVRFNPAINNLRPGVHEGIITFRPVSEKIPPLRTTTRVIVEGDASALLVLPDEQLSRQVHRPVNENLPLYEFEIENLGTQTGNWTASLDDPRLALATSNGTIKASEKVQLQVFPSPEFRELEDGLHTVKLTIEDSSNSASTRVVRWLPIELLPEKAAEVHASIDGKDLVLQLKGPANTRYLIEASSDLTTWIPFSTIQTSNTGTATFRKAIEPVLSQSFLRFTPSVAR